VTPLYATKACHTRGYGQFRRAIASSDCPGSYSTMLTGSEALRPSKLAVACSTAATPQGRALPQNDAASCALRLLRWLLRPCVSDRTRSPVCPSGPSEGQAGDLCLFDGHRTGPARAVACPTFGQAGPPLALLKVPEGRGRTCVAASATGTSDERSVCTTYDGPSFGRRASCLAQPSRASRRQPMALTVQSEIASECSTDTDGSSRRPWPCL
jgi:hypothetical protein